MDEGFSDTFLHNIVDDTVESVIHIKPTNGQSALIDGFDELYLVIVKEESEKLKIRNVLHNSLNIQIRWVNQLYFTHIIENRFHRRFVQWTLQGAVLYDRNNYIKQVRDRFFTYPSAFHSRNICVEFTRFLRHYLEAREHVSQGQIFDAYNSMFYALHHWARLAVIEAGKVPETVVWQQVSEIDYSIFKLYEELITTDDPLVKRIELLLLASEFSVISKMGECSAFLLNIMRTKEGAWSVDELLHHPKFYGVQFDLILLLEKLSKRSLLREVFVESEYGMEKKYIVE
ncbi:nucleotidyltransferase-like protein [Aneurinibacillus aneurinilyticus]|uniref:nucleotidyltransferase-like protein n=1 Tax=Aneurinibacillus aneurinilyticus TaxID=1391 RepID=UPI002E1DDD89|nr:nucleotidyltransferase-like protein [Aneurinibacillus aneurinilyticus]